MVLFVAHEDEMVKVNRDPRRCVEFSRTAPKKTELVNRCSVGRKPLDPVIVGIGDKDIADIGCHIPDRRDIDRFGVIKLAVAGAGVAKHPIKFNLNV